MRDLEDAGERGYFFDLVRVERAIGFFADVLKLNGAQFEGRAFILEPWQAFIVGSLFGWVDVDGWRRFRQAYIEIGKGNGKSPLAAGIGLYGLVADGETRAEIYAAASKKDQALILFRDAVAMVNQSPELHSRLLSIGGATPWNLHYRRTNSFFRAISADNGQSGPRPHISLVDEVHEHKNGEVIEMLKAGQKGRRQPLLVEMTNSGVDRQSICFEHHIYSQKVCSGAEENDEWFAYVCGIDKGDDPIKDESCWIKANPNLGKSITLKYLRTQVRDAIGMPSLLSKVRRLNFCMWVDAATPWIDGDLWLACEDDFNALEVLKTCDEVNGGLDLSGAIDLSALALTGIKDGKVIALVEFWTPGDTLLERARRDKVHYDTWVSQGLLHAPPGRGIAYDFVANRIGELQAILPQFRRMCFDKYRIKYLEKELDELGIELELIPHAQGYYKAEDLTPEEIKRKVRAGEKVRPNMWMPRSVELIETVVGEGRMRVQRNPVLTWNSASAVLEADPKGNRIFTKRKSRGRIDGMLALTMSNALTEEPPLAIPKRTYHARVL